jgi:hypothetical protein
MKKTLIALCIIALLLNLYFVSFYNVDNEDDPLTKLFFGSGGSGVEDVNATDDDIDENFEVNVPEAKLGDEVYYNYDTYIEWAGENTSSGDFWRIILDINGDLENKIPTTPENKKDGFYVSHKTVRTYQRTKATFDLTYEDQDTDEPLVIHGSGDIERSEFMDLTTQSTIAIETEASVEVSQTFQVDVPIKYSGKLRSYPDPKISAVETMDDLIFKNNQTLSIGKNGTFQQAADIGVVFNFPFTITQKYNWTVEDGGDIGGVDTLMINVSTKFFEFLEFKRQIWVANEISEPAKIFLRTNYSYTNYETDYSEYLTLEQSREMTSYKRGTKDIPWGSCETSEFIDPKDHFSKLHPMGEFTDWDFIPESAVEADDFEDSSFDLAPEAAAQFAIENSEGLEELMNDHSWDVIVNRAKYNITRDAQDKSDPDDKAGNFQWNMTFGYHPTQEEYEQYREEYYSTGYVHQNRYNLRVDLDKNRILNPLPTQPDYEETMFIAEERGYLNNSGPISKSSLDDEILTLTTSEKIFRADTETADTIFQNPSEPGEIWWDEPTYEVSYEFVVSGESSQADPIISTITGITFPPAPRMSWSIYKESLMSSGYMYGARLNAETGQLNYVVEIEGTALMGLFG